MLTTIDQFAGQDIWVYAELDEFSEDTYIRVQQVLDDEVIFNAAFSNDGDDIDEILYGELTSDIDSIEIHPLDTLTTEALIAKIKAANGVTASRQFTKYPSNYVKASRHWGEKTECKTKNGKIVRMQNVSSIFNGQDYYILYDADGNFVEKSLDFSDLHDKLYGIKASNYVNAAKGGKTYTAFYNGEIFDVSSNCDALIKQLKAEIDEAIAEGGAEDIDFGECWVELDSNEEVMYIADGDSDYAEYL